LGVGGFMAKIINMTFLGAMLVFIPSAGLEASGRSADKGAIKVFVSIEPQAFLVERVGGSHVEVGVLVGPGQSPHTYEPAPRQMAALEEARVFFRIGVPFEERILTKISSVFADLEVVDTRLSIALRRVDSSLDPESHAGEAAAHGEGSLDPHIWLDPKLARIQAGTVCSTLCRIDPAHSSDYRKNLDDLVKDLDELDARISELLAPYRGEAIYVFHPAFGYFTDSYGLRQVAVETGGKEPGARELAGLASRMREDSVRVVFTSPQFAGAFVRSLGDALGCRVVRLDPLARDYLKNLEQIAQEIALALESRKKTPPRP